MANVSKFRRQVVLSVSSLILRPVLPLPRASNLLQTEMGLKRVSFKGLKIGVGCFTAKVSDTSPLAVLVQSDQRNWVKSSFFKLTSGGGHSVIFDKGDITFFFKEEEGENITLVARGKKGEWEITASLAGERSKDSDSFLAQAQNKNVKFRKKKAKKGPTMDLVRLLHKEAKKGVPYWELAEAAGISVVAVGHLISLTNLDSSLWKLLDPPTLAREMISLEVGSLLSSLPKSEQSARWRKLQRMGSKGLTVRMLKESLRHKT